MAKNAKKIKVGSKVVISDIKNFDDDQREALGPLLGDVFRVASETPFEGPESKGSAYKLAGIAPSFSLHELTLASAMAAVDGGVL